LFSVCRILIALTEQYGWYISFLAWKPIECVNMLTDTF
jgi:hypothetical protein